MNILPVELTIQTFSFARRRGDPFSVLYLQRLSRELPNQSPMEAEDDLNPGWTGQRSTIDEVSIQFCSSQGRLGTKKGKEKRQRSNGDSRSKSAKASLWWKLEKSGLDHNRNSVMDWRSRRSEVLMCNRSGSGVMEENVILIKTKNGGVSRLATWRENC